MSQDKYNKYCELVAMYKKYMMNNELKQAELNKYISRVERLLNDEYRYGSSRLDLYFLEKYLNKCEQLVQTSGF
jgi:hypothetical protein